MKKAPVGRLSRLCIVGIQSEAACNYAPVYQVPPGRAIIGATVLIVEVIGVFPYIQTQEGSTLDLSEVHQWVVLIGSGGYNQLTGFIFYQPCPAGSESAQIGRAHV